MMRIDDTGNPRVDFNKQMSSGKTKSTTKKSAASEADLNIGEAPDKAQTSRNQRIEELKAMFQAGKPIDVQKLADKLVQSGLFFDEKA